MKKFTVVLLYPDFIASNYGMETYISEVVAMDPNRAVRNAQLDAVSENLDYNPEPEDFHPLFTAGGWHEDRTPETWR